MSKRPYGLPDETNFEIINTESKALNDDEVKLKTLWLSPALAMQKRLLKK